MNLRHYGVALLLACTACGIFGGKRPSPVVDGAAERPVGLARFTTARPPGERGPSNERGQPAVPKVTARFSAPPATNEWWSSLVWPFRDDGAFSFPMFAHPLVLRAEATGLGVSYPTHAIVKARRYAYPYERDLRLSVDGLEARDARLDGSSDWAVTASIADATRELLATFGHGMPFVYARVKGGDAVVDTASDVGTAHVWAQQGEVVGLTIHGHAYGLFAPRGSTWTQDRARFRSSLAGRGYFSVAVLPDESPDTLERFRRHAYAFVKSTRVDWAYDAAGARIETRFVAESERMEEGKGLSDAPILALYPHQWKHTRADLARGSYVSPRGPMKLVEAGSFTTELAAHGLLPVLPAAQGVSRDELSSLLAESASGELFPPGPDGNKDSYWGGKALGRAANLVWLADQIGDHDRSGTLVRKIEAELEDWFDGRTPRLFYYDDTWRTLVGAPSGYQSGTELNDHHFHYGYFLWAAATVAARDPAWAASERWGGMVELLAKDAANWDSGDTRFPRLRNFDPYAGHSWASGPAMFDAGNNEESSSEDMNFAAGLALFGAATGNDAMRDTGLFLYETLASAIEQYWFDADGDVFPPGFRHAAVGIVWGDGAAYDTWWDRNPVYVHGINVLPLTAASLYLGRRPDVLRRAYAELLAANRGPVHQWRDVLWGYLAMADPDEAHAMFAQDHAFDPEQGGSWAFTYHFIETLRALGTVDTTVSADTPFYGVFHRNGVRTYAAYNPKAAPTSVRFSDGTQLTVPPRAHASVSRPQEQPTTRTARLP